MAETTTPQSPVPGQIVNVSLADLSLDRAFNPRIYSADESDADLKTFGETIISDAAAIYGMKRTRAEAAWPIRCIQPPIVVRRGGTYTVFEGRRRVSGLKLAIPETEHARVHLAVELVDGEDKSALARLALHANTARKNLSVTETAIFGHNVVRKMLSTPEKAATEAQIASFLGIAPQTWANTYKPIAEAPPKIRSLVHNGELQLGVFSAIKAQLKSDPILADLFADKVKAAADAKRAAAAAITAEDTLEPGPEPATDAKNGKSPKKNAATKRTSPGTKVEKPGKGKSTAAVAGAEAIALFKDVQASRGVVPANTKKAEDIAKGLDRYKIMLNKITGLLKEMIDATEGVRVTIGDYSQIFVHIKEVTDGRDVAEVKEALLNIVQAADGKANV